MTTTHRSVRFPSIVIGSYAEFAAYRESNRSLLDWRYLYETGLATTEPNLARPGTCSTCLRATTYTSSTAQGETLSDGRVMPSWREQQYCDCEDRLSQRGRALLHFALASKTLQPWTRLLLFGRPTAVERRLGDCVRDTTTIRRMQLDGPDANGQQRYRIVAADGAFHTIVSADSLQHIPPLSTALAELHRVLVPGGRFVFTIPFHISSSKTVSDIHILSQRQGLVPVDVEAEVHGIGWDIIDRLHEAGFEDARAHIYWSDELGYLGSFKTIFLAVR